MWPWTPVWDDETTIKVYERERVFCTFSLLCVSRTIILRLRTRQDMTVTEALEYVHANNTFEENGFWRGIVCYSITISLGRMHVAKPRRLLLQDKIIKIGHLEVLLLLHFPLEHGTDRRFFLAACTHSQRLAHLPYGQNKKADASVRSTTSGYMFYCPASLRGDASQCCVGNGSTY